MAERIISSMKACLIYVVYPIRKCKFLFFFSWILSYIICLSGNLLGIPSSLFLTFLLSISDSYLLCVFACILNFIRLGWLVNLVVGIILYSELFVVFFNHSFLNRYTVQLILETNKGEGTQFISSVIFSKEAFLASLIFLFAFCLVLFIVRVSKKELKFKNFLVYVLAILVIWSCIRQYSSYKKINRCFHAKKSIECEKQENIPHLETPYIRLLYGIAYNLVLSGPELETLNASVAATVVDSCSFRCPFILLVIGESYNKHRCFLYNKEELPNTPRLQERLEKGNLVLYDDVISPYNHTHVVFRNMFSTWDDTCDDHWSNHTLFPAVFKKAGYNVFFITNQFTVKSQDEYNILGGTLFNHYNLSNLQFTGRNTDEHTFDLELLGDIPDNTILGARPTLLIVHLLGQHVAYCDRAPEEFKHFSPSQVNTDWGGENGKNITADYENAVYYNDYVVDSLFKMFDHQDMVAIYFADHGEEVYNWRDKFMRTDEETVLPQVAKYQYEIPFMFYMTEEFTEKHKDVAAEIEESSSKPFILTDFPNLLFHLGGIKVKDYNADKDLLSPQYDTTRKRLVRDIYDYDNLIKELRK